MLVLAKALEIANESKVESIPPRYCARFIDGENDFGVYSSSDKGFDLSRVTLYYEKDGIERIETSNLAITELSTFDNTNGIHYGSFKYVGLVIKFKYTVLDATKLVLNEFVTKSNLKYTLAFNGFNDADGFIKYKFSDGFTYTLELSKGNIYGITNLPGKHTATVEYKNIITNIDYEIMTPISKEFICSQNEFYFKSDKSKNCDGMYIKYTYEDGQVITVDVKSTMIKDFSSDKLGSFTGKVIYYVDTFDFNYTIKEDRVVKNKLIEIKYLDPRIEDKLPLLKIKSIYESGKTEIFDCSAELIPEFNYENGTHTVKTTYKGADLEFTYTYVNPAIVKIVQKYQTFDIYDSVTIKDIYFDVKAIYEDDYNKTITLFMSDLDEEVVIDESVGEHIITLKYKGFEISYKYTIIE